MKSILQTNKECFMCRKLYGEDIGLTHDGLEEHHVMFGTADRQISDRYGLTVWLCPSHHNRGMFSAHMNRKTNLILRRHAQREFEKQHSHDEWMELFGKNYMEV